MLCTHLPIVWVTFFTVYEGKCHQQQQGGETAPWSPASWKAPEWFFVLVDGEAPTYQQMTAEGHQRELDLLEVV
ncbi:rCG54376 [Rattus norvegicus]|uniref:RCG54376 n=1 Tax=Rattus norvegicus TaxID=10116 RepID=A6JBI0_RAT|nr:rCG54376 [Rattus norvegicus]